MAGPGDLLPPQWLSPLPPRPVRPATTAKDGDKKASAPQPLVIIVIIDPDD